MASTVQHHVLPDFHAVQGRDAPHATRSEWRALTGGRMSAAVPSSPSCAGLRRVTASTTSVDTMEMQTSAAPRTCTQNQTEFHS